MVGNMWKKWRNMGNQTNWDWNMLEKMGWNMLETNWDVEKMGWNMLQNCLETDEVKFKDFKGAKRMETGATGAIR